MLIGCLTNYPFHQKYADDQQLLKELCLLNWELGFEEAGLLHEIFRYKK